MPQSPRRTVRRGLVATALVALAPALVSCGFDPPTNQVYQPAVGSNFRDSDVDVLGAVVVADSAGSGRFIATFVNNLEGKSDSVVGISGAGRDSGVQVQASGPVDLPPGGLVNLADTGQAPILITGKAIKPGYLVDLRFTFQNAEAVSFRAQVVGAFEQYADLGPGGSASAEPLPSPPPSEDAGNPNEYPSPTPSPEN